MNFSNMTEQDLQRHLASRGGARLASDKPQKAPSPDKGADMVYGEIRSHGASERPQKPGAKLKGSSEHKEQVKLFKWAAENEKYYPHLAALFAVPNGAAKSSRIEASRMKKEGLKNGVLDVHLPVPIGEFSGLWIEIKYMYNKMSESQREWADLMRWVGHRVETCYSFEEARWVLLDYLTESSTNLRKAA